MTELRRAKVNGIDVAYRRAGAGPTLVLLHGFASDSRAWQPQLDELASELDVVAWDAPGCGASADPPITYTFDEWADDLAGLLDALSIRSAHVLGLSWGGVLAQVFWKRHPGRVRSMILADTYAGWTGSLGGDAAAQRLVGALEDSTLPPAAFADRYLPGMFGPSPPPASVRATREILADRHPGAFRRMATVLAEADTRHLLRGIDVATRLLWGSADVRAPIAVGREIQAANPEAGLVLLEGAGHLSNLDRPAEFNAAVVNFIHEG